MNTFETQDSVTCAMDIYEMQQNFMTSTSEMWEVVERSQRFGKHKKVLCRKV